NLVDLGTHYCPPHVHSNGALRNIETVTEVNPLLLPNGQFVDCIQDLDSIEAVDDTNFPCQVPAARRLRFDEKRSEQGTVLLNNHLRVAVALDRIGVRSGQVKV